MSPFSLDSATLILTALDLTETAAQYNRCCFPQPSVYFAGPFPARVGENVDKQDAENVLVWLVLIAPITLYSYY